MNKINKLYHRLGGVSAMEKILSREEGWGGDARAGVEVRPQQF